MTGLLDTDPACVNCWEPCPARTVEEEQPFAIGSRYKPSIESIREMINPMVQEMKRFREN